MTSGDSGANVTRRRKEPVAFCLLALAGLSLAPAPAPAAADARNAGLNPAITRIAESAPESPVGIIVQARGSLHEIEAEVVNWGGRIDREFLGLNGFAATVRADQADRLNRDPRVSRIDENATVRLLGNTVVSNSVVNRYTALEQLKDVWSKGADGSEVQVAVIDSGVYPHDDLTLKSPYVPANLGNRLLPVVVNPAATDVIDHIGHGTHVAGILAGNGYDSAGKYIGVAPNSLLVSVKVSDDLGNANEGDLITGLEWVYAANQHGMKIRVVNLSLASSATQSYNSSALDAMVEKLWASGVVVVVSTGVGADGKISAPGNDPYVISVGSVEDNYQTDVSKLTMATFSSYGATVDGFPKPDVVADGSHVVSLLAPGSSLSIQHPGNVVGNQYFMMGGTSMAAPQVAGLAALMLQAQPGLTNDQVKGVLMKHDKPFGNTAYTSWLGNQGGLINQDAFNHNDATANAGTTYSQAYSPSQKAFLAGGNWWTGADWPNASWNSTAWNSTAWNSTAWNSTAWNSTAWNSTSWNSTAWNSTAWNSTAWNSTAWNSTAWNSTAWNSTAWNDSAFQ